MIELCILSVLLVHVNVKFLLNAPMGRNISSYWQNHNESYVPQRSRNQPSKRRSSLVRVLVVTKAHNKSFSKLAFPESLHGCEVTYAEGDPSRLGNISAYDALVYHLHDLKYHEYLSLTETSSSKPKRVLIDLEPPLRIQQSLRFLSDKQKDFKFHWFINYRSDSDIQVPYGMVIRRTDYQHWIRKPVKAWYHYSSPLWTLFPRSYLAEQYLYQLMGYEMLEENTLKKSKAVVWSASDCNGWSNRDKYVKELAEYVPIDVYGRCGDHYCSKETPLLCWRKFEDTYKFFLAFENSICKEYVTEKLFVTLMHNIVPVVLGGANYTAVAPPDSYIDALQFSGPKELAQHLKYLSENPEEYNKLMAWKRDYFVVSIYLGFLPRVVCRQFQKKLPRTKLKSYVELERKRLLSTKYYVWNEDSKSVTLQTKKMHQRAFMTLYKKYKARAISSKILPGCVWLAILLYWMTRYING